MRFGNGPEFGTISNDSDLDEEGVIFQSYMRGSESKFQQLYAHQILNSTCWAIARQFI